MKTIVHVNQRVIKSNLKNSTDTPVLTVKKGKSNQYTNEVIIRDNMCNPVAKIIYSPDKPLSCGARVWIEVANERNIEVVDGISWDEVKVKLEGSE